MAEPSLSTPVRTASPHIVERPRLTSLLDDATARTVLLVAPPGYGKTTLVRQWLAKNGVDAVWHRATHSSADVAVLASEVARAATEAFGFECPRIAQRLRALSDPNEEAASLGRVAAGDLRPWPSEVWLVLDDYHALASSDPADEFLRTLVGEVHFNVIISGRERPRWISSRDILYGNVFEIGQSALAMTHTEAAAALKSSVNGAHLRGLVALADGWPAVIGLASLTSRSVEIGDGVVPEALYDFFAEELYRELDEVLQRDLCSLAPASTVTMRLASTLFGNGAARVLEDGERKGFLTRQEAQYELHPLLRRFLMLKLAEFDFGWTKSLAAKICRWEIEEGHDDEAFNLAGRFELKELMFDIIEAGLDPMLAQGRTASVQKWVDAARKRDPMSPTILLGDLELSFRRHHWDEARSHALRLTSSLAESDPRMSRALHRIGQIEQLDDRYDEAMSYLARAKNTAQTNPDLRAALSSEFLVASDYGDQARAKTILDELKLVPGASADELLRLSQAELHLASRWGGIDRELRRQAGSLALADHSVDPLVRTGFLQTFGAALVLAGKYGDAYKIAERQISEAEDSGLEWAVPHALELRGSAEWGLRKFDRAHATVREALRLALAQEDVHARLNAAVLLARIHLSQGAPERALEVTQLDVDRPPGPSMQGDFLAIRALAYALIDDTDSALTLAQESETWTDHIDVRVACFFVRAIAQLKHGGTDSGQSVVVALNATWETGVYDGFVVAYRAYPPLLAALSRVDEPAASACRNHVLSVDRRLAERAGLAPRSRHEQSPDPLTAREREVLALIRRGLSNREIATTLWIAESTAKVHVRNVLRKLGARSRTEAASAAFEG